MPKTLRGAPFMGIQNAHLCAHTNVAKKAASDAATHETDNPGADMQINV